MIESSHLCYKIQTFIECIVKATVTYINEIMNKICKSNFKMPSIHDLQELQEEFRFTQYNALNKQHDQ